MNKEFSAYQMTIVVPPVLLLSSGNNQHAMTLTRKWKPYMLEGPASDHSLQIRRKLTILILTVWKGRILEWHRGEDGGGRRERGTERVLTTEDVFIREMKSEF